MLTKNKFLLVLLFFLFTATIVLSPIIYKPSILEAIAGDVYHNLWIWGRNVSNVLVGLAPYTANIFFPDKLSSFYSEMEVGHSILYALLFGLHLHAIKVYLILLIMSFALTGVMVAVMACELGASTTGSILGGTIAAFLSYRYTHLSHIQILAVYWLLLPLFFSLRYLRTGHGGYLFLTFLFHIIVLCGPSYNLLGLVLAETAIFMAFILNTSFTSKDRYKRSWLLGGTIIGAGLCTLPFWFGFLEVFRAGFSRGHDAFVTYSMDLSSFIIPPINNLMYGSFSNLEPGKVSEVLLINTIFLGVVTLSLIVLSIFYRPHAKQCADKPNLMNTYPFIRAIKWCGIGLLLLSLGPYLTWKSTSYLYNPIFKIAETIHLLSATRYIAHLAYLGIVFLAIVVAVQTTYIFSSLNLKARTYVQLGLACLIVIENFNNYAPHLSRYSKNLSQQPNLFQRLARISNGKGVLFLPLPISFTPEDKAFKRQFIYMHYSTFYHLNIFNGVSGFFPPHYLEGMNIFKAFPNLAGFYFLAKQDLSYIVYDKKVGRIIDFSPQSINGICQGCLTPLWTDTNYSIFRIEKEQIIKCFDKKFNLKKVGDKQVIDFNQPNWPGVISYIDGLSTPEAWGTWSSGKEINIKFSKPLPRQFSLHLTASAFGPNSNKYFIISNGYEQKNFTVSETVQAITLLFNNPNHSDCLKIKIPNPVSPLDLGQSQDPRKLGIGLRTMSITKIK